MTHSLPNFIDLRSDTVTRPTPEMRLAMAEAPVGDDVHGEDPTINRLQEMAAERLGKQAALFMPSGTMGNLAAILSHCGRGDEAIMGHLSHTFQFEVGGCAALGGVQPFVVPNQADGTMALDAIRYAIRQADVHHPTTRLIILENTHNWAGGIPLSAEYTRQVGDLAHQHGLILHLDGARLFNAAVALGVPVSDLAAPADTVTFCLSKGLGAPAGSLLCGSAEFIAKATRIRKQLGGGMRQVGILAAAGIVALEHMADRLQDDHERAARLAAGLRGLQGLALESEKPATNIIFCELSEDCQLSVEHAAAGLGARRVLIDIAGPRRLRMVTHNDVDDAGIAQTIQAFQDVFGRSEPAEIHSSRKTK